MPVPRRIPCLGSGRSPARAPHRAGLTLLEVLAAVAILGIVYTVLADLAMQGLLAEGEARRRLEASTLADRELAKLEGQMESGAPLELGVSEREENGFEVRVEVTPLDLRLPEPPRSPSRRREAPTDPGVALGPSLLFASRTGEVSALRQVEIAVTWAEGGGEREVTRTTFAFDRESVAPLLEQLDAEAVSRGQTRSPTGRERES